MIFKKPEDYLSEINAIFDTAKERLRLAIPNGEVEHIGSSAINGAISKGDLDILVRISKDNFNEAVTKIEKLGFTIKEGTLRTESLCMFETTEFEADVAIQLIEAGSEFENFILFRDRLNADAELVSRYNELKLSSSLLSPDQYRAKKSEFIKMVLAS